MIPRKSCISNTSRHQSTQRKIAPRRFSFSIRRRIDYLNAHKATHPLASDMDIVGGLYIVKPLILCKLRAAPVGGHLPLLTEQLKETQRGIDNLLNAIQQGIFTKSTKGRLEELEAAKEELEIKIANEKIAKLDKLIITFNHKDGAETITLNDIETALTEQKDGSDLVSSAVPKIAYPIRDTLFLMLQAGLERAAAAQLP